MDSILNNCIIPKNTDSLVKLEPISKTFINGLSKKYSDVYPRELEPHLQKEKFFQSITEINTILATCWPCLPAFLIGYFCCPCTLGCSFLIPFLCISDAEKMLLSLLEDQNHRIYQPNGLKIRLRKKCCTSWLEIEVVSSVELEIIDSKLEKREEENLLF